MQSTKTLLFSLIAFAACSRNSDRNTTPQQPLPPSETEARTLEQADPEIEDAEEMDRAPGDTSPGPIPNVEAPVDPTVDTPIEPADPVETPIDPMTPTPAPPSPPPEPEPEPEPTPEPSPVPDLEP